MPMLYCGETGGQTYCSLLVDLDGVTSPIRHVQCCAEACILSVGEDRLLPPSPFSPSLRRRVSAGQSVDETLSRPG